MSYNGWTNYETWDVNDEGTHSQWIERATEHIEKAKPTEVLTPRENAAEEER